MPMLFALIDVYKRQVQGGLRLQAFYQRIVRVFAEEAEQVHQ